MKLVLHSSGKYYYAAHNPTIRADLNGNVYGGGIDLNGDADYLSQADGLSTDITGADQTLTISCWMYRDIDSGGNECLIGKYDSGAGNNRSYLLYIDGSDKASFIIDGVGDGGARAYGSTAMTVGIWRHVCGVYDDTDIRVYINGSLDTNGGYNPKTYNGGLYNNGQTFKIGAYNQTPTGFFNGKITDIAVWDTALTAAQVSAIYKSKLKYFVTQIEPSNLKLYLPLDDYPAGHGTLASTTFQDRSGNGSPVTGTDADNDSDVIAEEILSYPGGAIYVDDLFTTSYSRGNYSSLPTGTGDLETPFSPADYTTVSADDASRVSQSAS